MNSADKWGFVDKDLMLDMDEKATIQLVCSRHSVKVIMELLARLKNLGDAGCSRCISIEGSQKKMFFDGDGSDHIYSYTLNGRSLDEWVEKQRKRIELKAASRPDMAKLLKLYQDHKDLAALADEALMVYCDVAMRLTSTTPANPPKMDAAWLAFLYQTDGSFASHVDKIISAGLRRTMAAREGQDTQEAPETPQASPSASSEAVPPMPDQDEIQATISEVREKEEAEIDAAANEWGKGTTCSREGTIGDVIRDCN